MTHFIPSLTTAGTLLLAALLLTACHGKADDATAKDSISFADTMTIDMHPENDQSVVDTSEPIPEPSHKEEAKEENPDDAEAAPEASSTDDDAAPAPSADAPAEAPAPTKGDKETTANP